MQAEPDLGSNYRKTRYGWEPVQDWKTSPIRLDSLTEALNIISSLVGETVACGVPPHRAVRWWDYILRHPALPLKSHP